MEVYLSAAADAAGDAVISVRPDGGQSWSVTQISPECQSASSNATGTIRKNGALVAPFEPRNDAVGGDPAVTLVLGDVITVEWTNLAPGTSARALVFYEVIP